MLEAGEKLQRQDGAVSGLGNTVLPSMRCLSPSPDIDSFVREVEAKLNSKNWEFGQTVHGRIVNHPEWGERYLSFQVCKVEDLADSAGVANPESGQMTLYATKKYDNFGTSRFTLILHEVLHQFDPKLSRQDLIDAAWGVGTAEKLGYSLQATGDPEKDARYRSFAWEVDASPYPQGRELVNNLFWLHGDNKVAVADAHRHHKPEGEFELEWAKHPKVWRRYLKTLYAIYCRSLHE